MATIIMLVSSLISAVPLSASDLDLAKIDRTIAKEPAYQSKDVKYCLLVFGPEAKTHVWLVQDGDNLLVDRNGNGDLTESGERVISKKRDDTNIDFDFEGGDIQVGTLIHKNLRLNIFKLDHASHSDEQAKSHLSRSPEGLGCYLTLEVEMPGLKGRGIDGRVDKYVPRRDARGFLEFGNTPKTAPIIHFDGPLAITLFGYQCLTVGREIDLMLGVGTPGLGAGTTAFVAYEGIVPPKAHPKVEMEYPPKNGGDAPIKETYELKQRC